MKRWGDAQNNRAETWVDFTHGGTPSDGSSLVTFPGTDKFGRITNVTIASAAQTIVHRYQYSYDSNANRTNDVIQQVPISRVYWHKSGYDRLNRLIHAELEQRELNPASGNWSIVGTPTGRAWKLDPLGNWSGDTSQAPEYAESVIDYAANSVPGFQPGPDTPTRTEHHEVGFTNQIVNRHVDEDVVGASSSTLFTYDAAGNLTNDGIYCYVYNAFNRLVRVSKWIPATAACGDTVATYRYDALGRRILDTPPPPSAERLHRNRRVKHDAARQGQVEKVDFAHRHPTLNFVPKEYYYYDGDRVIMAAKRP